MAKDERPDAGVFLVLAACAALAAAFVAVTLHSRCVEEGYRVRDLERRHVDLERQADAARGRVAALRNPHDLLGRARSLGVTLHYDGPDARYSPAADALGVRARVGERRR